MKIIYKGRGKGKTTELIKISNDTGAYIVCHNQNECSRIQALALESGNKIPFPLTYDEFINHEYHSAGIKAFLIDNAELLLQHISKVHIYAITLTERAP